MTKLDKIKIHLKNGSIFHLIKEKMLFGSFNSVIHNKNVTEKVMQSRNYKKLKRKFNYILQQDIELKKKTNSNIIWFCWLQGYDKAPELVKACYNSIKKCTNKAKVVFLSEKNIREYIELPYYIEEKYKKGKIGRAHYSDLVRISLLCKYGGMWIDSTVLCTSPKFVEYIMDQPLFVFKQVDLTRNDKDVIVSSNWLISAEANNEICLLTQKLLFEYWKKYSYAIDYFIFHLFFSMATEKYSNIWNEVPTFNNINPHMMQFELNNNYSEERWKQLTSMSGVHKLNHHFNYDNNDTIYNNIIKKYTDNKEEKV